MSKEFIPETEGGTDLHIKFPNKGSLYNTHSIYTIR